MPEPKTGSNIAAFFDMDQTVVLCNTGRLYVEDLRRRGEIGWRDLVKASTVLLRYRLSLIDVERVMHRVVEHLEGVEVETMRERCDALFESHIRPLVSRAAIEAIEGHRRLGHRVVLLTAQTPLLVEPLSRMLGIEDYLCTRLGTDDGRFTGQIDGPPCYGAGKIHWAKDFAAQHQLDLERSYFYTDSYTDLPMLEAVSHRRVVNPDPRLRLHARLNRWPVLRFAR